MRAASCEAICSERAGRRRAKCNSEMYCNICTLHRGTSSLTVPEACCNYHHLKFAIFATVFLASDIVLRLGVGASLRICRAVPSEYSLIILFLLGM